MQMAALLKTYTAFFSFYWTCNPCSALPLLLGWGHPTCKILLQPIPRFCLGDFGGHGLTWNILWKNRLVKQRPKVAILRTVCVFDFRSVFHEKFTLPISSNRRNFGRSKKRASAAQSTSLRCVRRTVAKEEDSLELRYRLRWSIGVYACASVIRVMICQVLCVWVALTLFWTSRIGWTTDSICNNT